jgi:hypothetical protein
VIFVHNRYRGVGQLAGGVARRLIDRVGEGIHNQEDQHHVGADAAQLLDPQTKDVFDAFPHG